MIPIDDRTAKPESAKHIFLRVICCESQEERNLALENACRGDALLRARVESLINAQSDSAPNLLDQLDGRLCPTERLGSTDHEFGLDIDIDVTSHPVIGPYTIREQIGEGGMGTVYVAEQKEPVRRKVALKIIRAGMASKEIVARFEAERQALAMMDHPNIARVIDGGTTPTGQPYFAMELVQGTPITQYADAHQMSIDERLAMFVKVCLAVQHAHRKGVIHRDLKPSNVLVASIDGQAVPKVIDFGLAKAISQPLTDATLYTGFSRMMGTPMYMSPEQAEMGVIDIDTRCDVYALGVMLYELLTGDPPFSRETFKSAGFDEVRRIIREVEPKRPSFAVSTLVAERQDTIADQRHIDSRKLRDLLHGELDWIVMKALEKDRGRRYESASVLSADIERYLCNEPVEACPPSNAYVVRTYIRRHPALFRATVAIAIMFLVANGLLWNERAQTLAALADATAQGQLAQTQTALADEREKIARKNEEEALLQRNSALLNQYRAEIVSGQVDQQAGEVTRLEQKLLRHLPVVGQVDHRGWEWHYLFSACHSETHSIRTLGDNPKYSPGGEYVASCGWIYDSKTGEMIRRIQSSWIRTTKGDWSPDGKKYAWGTCADDSCIYIWDRETDELAELRGFKNSNSIWSVHWSPDGKYLASGGMDTEVWVWDVAARTSIRKLDAGKWGVTDVAWSPDGEMLAAGIKWNSVRVWNPKSGELLADLPDLGERGRSYSVRLSWHPSSDQLAVMTPESWLLIRPSDWTVIRQEDGGQSLGYSVAWDPEGERIAVANGSFVAILDATDDNGAAELTLPVGAPVKHVTWSPDGNNLLTLDDSQTMKAWDLISRIKPPVLSADTAVQSLSWLSDNETVVAVDATKQSRHTWSETDGFASRVEPALTEGQHFWSPDKRLAAILSGMEPERIRILNGSTGAVHSVLELDPSDLVHNIAWSNDGTKLAIRMNRGARTRVEFWNVEREQRISVWKLNGQGLSRDFSLAMVWSSDGTYLAVSAMGEQGDNGTDVQQGHVYVVDASRGQTIMKHNLAGRDDGSIVASLAWSPDSASLVAGSEQGRVEAITLDAGQVRFSNRVSDTPVRSIVWSPDGRRIASAAEDGMVKICDADSGDDLLRFQLGGKVSHVIWSPNGKRLAAATETGRIQIWDATKGYDLVESQSMRGELALIYHRAAQLCEPGEKEARLREMLKLAPDRLGFWEERGHAYAELGEFDRATEEFAKAIEPGLRRSFKAAKYYAYSLLGADKPEEYRRYCLSLCNAFAEIEVPSSGGRVALTCALTPNGQLDTKTLIRLVRAYDLADDGRDRKLYLGAVLYRNQEVKEAVEVLSDVAQRLEAMADPTNDSELATALYFLAMARYQMNHAHQAKRLLSNAAEIARNVAQTSDWTIRIQLNVLDQEARALIDASR